jgi:hypothetical protein
MEPQMNNLMHSQASSGQISREDREISSEESDHASVVRSLLQDPLLSDLPENAMLEEVKTLIAIEEGRAYRIRIKRNSLEDVRKCIRVVHEIRDEIQLLTLRWFSAGSQPSY